MISIILYLQCPQKKLYMTHLKWMNVFILFNKIANQVSLCKENIECLFELGLEKNEGKKYLPSICTKKH